MKKIFVFLGLSLLCWGSSFAQEREASTQVDPEAIQSYSDLTTVIKNIADAPVLNKAYNDAKAKEENLKNNEPPQKITQTPTTKVDETNPILTRITNFSTSAVSLSDNPDNPVITAPNELCYRIWVEKRKLTNPTFYLYVTLPNLTQEADTYMESKKSNTTSTYKDWIDTQWKQTNMDEIKSIYTEDNTDKLAAAYSLEREYSNSKATPAQICVFYKKTIVSDDQKTLTYEGLTADEVPVGTNVQYIFLEGWTKALEQIIKEKNVYGFEVTYIKEGDPQEVDNPAYATWLKNYQKAQEATTAAEAAWTAINKGDFYLNAANVFKITSNFEVPANKTNLTWPANRTLDGGCHKITGSLPVIEENDGTISNIITPEGRFVDTNNKKLRDCIFKQSNTEWRIYDNDGYKSYTSLKTAVYQLRDKFGYNVETNEATGPQERTTKLYEAKYTDAKHKDLYTFHVNLAENDGAEAFKYNKAQAALDNRLVSGIKRENTVIYINNADVPADVKAWINVATRNNVETEKYTCENVELIDGEKDGKETEEFYVPTGFAFKNIHYGRKFNQNMTALCLPFKLDANVKSALTAKLGRTIWYYTFKEVKGKTMWFNTTTEVEANTPCIIAYSGEPLQEGNDIFNALNLNGTTLPEFVSTNGATLGATASNTGELCFFGNYKFGQFANNLQALANGGKGSCIYGFQAGELRLMPEATEKDGELVGPRLHQFRSYIRLEADLTGNTAAPNSFNIGLLDEDGNVVTGIESVESGKEANGFKAVGGNSAIEISTDKACEVKVYTASGSLVKAVRVEAGNTTLPFGAGMYIVNQTKVVVK